MLKALKTKDDTAQPTLKADLYNRYISWKTRRPRPVEDVGEEAIPLEDGSLFTGDDGNEDTEDCIEAMLLLNGSGNNHEVHFSSV